MYIKPKPNQFSLLPDQPGVLEHARGVELRVLDGIVWVTITGEAGDRFLGAGNCLRITGSGRVLFEALRGPAQVSLMVPASWPVRLLAAIQYHGARRGRGVISAVSPALPAR